MTPSTCQPRWPQTYLQSRSAAPSCRFGMMIQINEAEADSRQLLAASLAHALVGTAEARASRAEDAANAAGAGPAGIGQAALMAVAGGNCQFEIDELALIAWRASRLCQVLSMLDFGGPCPGWPPPPIPPSTRYAATARPPAPNMP